MVGADLGGVEADHRAMLGKIVQWSADEVRTPTRTCSAAAARVVTLANRDLAQDWGGETISDLQLPRSLKARAFGKRSTRVLKGAACADDAVLATGDQLILMLDNGYIYLLRRMPGPARPSH